MPGMQMPLALRKPEEQLLAGRRSAEDICGSQFGRRATKHSPGAGDILYLPLCHPTS